ncbi:alpha/beta hydrolase [Nocardioides sp. NPDC051685]|uniref:alpha/beta hydrolase n=1 Tax=Nocardioides sp. NPDC051685 TaxID=3364334 RepID=UPI0037A7ED0F
MPRPFARALRSTLAILTLLAGGVAAAVPVANADDPQPPAGTISVPGATIVGERWLTQRTLELTVDTPSFLVPAKVEVTFPVGYDSQPTRDWPVSYFLVGTNMDQTGFRVDLRGEELSESYPAIVVTPSASPLDPTADAAGVDAPGGNVGYWSDWYNNGSGGPPMYETFVTKQLVPLIDANFNALANREGRAVFGGSMGGYGALMLAARHPDLFSSASSLSGAVDTNWVPGATVLSASPSLVASPPDSIYGPRDTQEVRWRGHNPVDLAGNLSTVDVQLYTGNGVPSADELASNALTSAGCVVEAGIVKPETDSLHAKLLALEIPHTYSAADWGCHTPLMFYPQVVATLNRFAENFAEDVPVQSSFDFRAIESQFGVFGWAVEADPARALEFLALQDVSVRGFTITGSGLTQITTAPLFRGARPITVVVNGDPSVVRPDDSGRLTVPVDLGPANQDQQYTLGGTTAKRTAFVQFIRS